MSPLLSRRLALLGERANLPLLSQCLHGIERECLRVDGNGKLALTPHPQALGSAGHEGLAVDIAVRGRCAGCAHPTNEAAA